MKGTGMKNELKLPARCALIPQEEQESICGGAPEWMENFVADVKETLRPYKPYLEFTWALLKVGVICAKEALLIYGYSKILIHSLKGIKSTLQNFRV